MTETTRDTDRQQNIFQLFDQNLVSSLHLSKKISLVEYLLFSQGKKKSNIKDNVSEDSNFQLHKQTFDTIIGGETDKIK